MNTVKSLILVTLFLSTLAGTVSAKVNGGDFYLHTKMPIVVIDETEQDERTRVGLQLFGGYNFSDYFGIELGHGKLLGLEDKSYNEYYDTTSLAFVGRANINRHHQVTLRVGASSSETDPFYSIGYGYFLYLESQVTFEFESHEIRDGSRLNGLVIGYQYNF